MPNAMRLRSLRLWACTAAAVAASASAQPLPDATAARVDALFAAFGSTGPGCALAIGGVGGEVHARAYGLADVAHRVPIGPDTVFDVGSVSKQFTALAVLLLVQEGKLRLEDTVQQHLPELARALPTRITLSQLLHHTAGLRDYNELLLLAGRVEEDVTGDDDALEVLRQAPALNFAPGSRYSYSNTGYFLAAQVVERVSGQRLPQFLHERVFKPLGMAATHVRVDHTEVVPHRASAYEPREQGGYLLRMSNWNQAGDGAVQSTVRDLARWQAELLQPKVFSAALLAALSAPGRLADGSPIGYGMGLAADRHRGLERHQHTGAWAGYRAATAQYPGEGLALALACNTAQASTGALLQRVAEVVLEGRFPEPALTPPAAAHAGFDGAAWLGAYLHEDGQALLRLQAHPRGGAMLLLRAGAGSATLMAQSARTLRSSSGATTLRLLDDDRTLELLRQGDPRPTRYLRLPAYTASPAAIQAWVGRYAEPDLRSEITLRRNGDALQLKVRGALPAETLELVAPDLALTPEGLLHLQRDAHQQVVGFEYRSERVRDLVYRRDADQPGPGGSVKR